MNDDRQWSLLGVLPGTLVGETDTEVISYTSEGRGT